MLAGLSCAPVDDVVFESTITVALVREGVSVREDESPLTLPLRLDRPAPGPISATFQLEGIEAQNNCNQPDFTSLQGNVSWETGQQEATIQLWVENDDLAETDERFALVLEQVTGARLAGSPSIEITIEDDDRDALIAASDHGVVPGSPGDQSAELQAALNRARDRGRGVVVLAPGDYLVTGIRVYTGTTLSGRGARLLRPADAGGGAITVTMSHSGADDSEPTLVEGITVDGRRELQGPYQNWQLSNAHLITAFGDIETPGRIRVNVEDVSVIAGTGDGIAIGPQSEAHLCNILAHDIWRDAVSLHGGGSALSLRNLGATATQGTSGLWLDGDTPGFGETRRVEIDLQDVNLSSGDFEASLAENSTMTLRRVTMDLPPFRLLAPDSHVEIHESRLYTGLLGPTREDELLPLNQWQIPHDVRVVETTLVASELPPEFGEALPEEARTFALAEVTWTADMVEVQEPTGHQLVFENCRFEVDGTSVEDNDTVYGIRSVAEGGTVIVRSSQLDRRFADWFAPECSACTLDN